MRKLAIIDLDGVVACSDARFAKATTNGKIDWAVAFDPALVTLDTPLQGARKRIFHLTLADYDICYLTSRPEAMREATVAWLAEHRLFPHLKLTMKPEEAKYTKTATWKVAEVKRLAANYDCILFVDDEIRHCQLVQQQLENVYCYTSLSDIP